MIDHTKLAYYVAIISPCLGFILVPIAEVLKYYNYITESQLNMICEILVIIVAILTLNYIFRVCRNSGE